MKSEVRRAKGGGRRAKKTSIGVHPSGWFFDPPDVEGAFQFDDRSTRSTTPMHRCWIGAHIVEGISLQSSISLLRLS